jgi:hypothetical protein
MPSRPETPEAGHCGFETFVTHPSEPRSRAASMQAAPAWPRVARASGVQRARARRGRGMGQAATGGFAIEAVGSPLSSDEG